MFLFGSSGLSWNLRGDIDQLFSYHFMVNAYWAGSVVAVTAGTTGWFMVLRRQSFAGHALANVSFPGAAGAILLGINATVGYFAATLAAAAVIALVPRSATGHSHSSESAVIGTVQAFALACGAIFVSLYGGFLNSLTNLLFGTFLGISDSQVLTLVFVSVAVLVVLGAVARPLFFATIDPDVARARGVPVTALSLIFLLLLACAVAEVSQITGVLLVFALLVMPAAAAQRLTARPVFSFALTVVLGLVIAWLGLAASYFSPYPVGFWITTLGFTAYTFAALGSLAKTRLGRYRQVPPILTA